jgi:hypothetical protein
LRARGGAVGVAGVWGVASRGGGADLASVLRFILLLKFSLPWEMPYCVQFARGGGTTGVKRVFVWGPPFRTFASGNGGAPPEFSRPPTKNNRVKSDMFII